MLGNTKPFFILQIIAPQHALQPFVKAFWFLDLVQGNAVPLAMTSVPEQCLYFYPKSPFLFILSVVPTLRAVDYESPQCLSFHAN
jgi:hypothetical protein